MSSDSESSESELDEETRAFNESLNVLLDSAGSKASGVSKLFC